MLWTEKGSQETQEWTCKPKKDQDKKDCDNAKKRAVHLTVNFRNINFDFKLFC